MNITLYGRYEVCIHSLEVDLLLLNFQDLRYTPFHHDYFIVFYFDRSFFQVACSFGKYVE